MPREIVGKSAGLGSRRGEGGEVLKIRYHGICDTYYILTFRCMF